MTSPIDHEGSSPIPPSENPTLYKYMARALDWLNPEQGQFWFVQVEQPSHFGPVEVELFAQYEFKIIKPQTVEEATATRITDIMDNARLIDEHTKKQARPSIKQPFRIVLVFTPELLAKARAVETAYSGGIGRSFDEKWRIGTKYMTCVDERLAPKQST